MAKENLQKAINKEIELKKIIEQLEIETTDWSEIDYDRYSYIRSRDNGYTGGDSGELSKYSYIFFFSY
ncbi:hypothetical protein [Geosporobacter ferrireducens]|uniref:Uncharacterized protein n=1 Tax=Geosporobacter ferrireducens TaxID=1424294 RepID=A0A1D8GNN5_9FIRM|nr:hypothetical protein [Geosporobacter ferrireducens]AOT72540.1 hypothetical protein Gferi_25090 [Geosporobacter ferrireducens]MTI54932.1 hypothetical protein [Geosporobacter ferrireducens]